MMIHIWEYQDCTGKTCRGAMRGFSDFGGSDVTYRFHRLDAAGRPIRHANGGICLDLVSGFRLKAAKKIGTMTLAEYEGAE